MARPRKLVSLPPEIVAEIDTLVGVQQRSAFLAEVLRLELKRGKQLRALDEAEGCWKDADHPELSEGGAAYVERIRSERDDRFESALHHQES
ncbi:MAG: hypothetical protein HY820_24785 [Acidobacteria bacterium]|nr:hypothetical protein [Acidobacteriota bacterium]